MIDLVDDDALIDTALAKADQVMANAPFGVTLTKEGMWTALEIPGMQAAIDLENRQQIMATATADHREAIAAFVDRSQGWGVAAGFGVLLAIVGIIVVAWPGPTIAILMVLVGLDAILFGISMIAQGLALRRA